MSARGIVNVEDTSREAIAVLEDVPRVELGADLALDWEDVAAGAPSQRDLLDAAIEAFERAPRGIARRRARRELVRLWECVAAGVTVYGAPTVDDVVRSRVLGDRRFGSDLLDEREVRLRDRDGGDDSTDCYSCGGGVRVAAMAERLRIWLATSAIAYEIESPDGGFLVAWRYDHEGDSPTPHERAQQIKARRKAVQS